MSTATLFDRVGGEQFFRTLVDKFYEGVAADPLLRPMYLDDLVDAREHLALFLIQYWGGPPHYASLRGHPRLRRRHAPFAIDDVARDQWLAHMRTALAQMHDGVEDKDRAELLSYFEMAAHQLRNR